MKILIEKILWLAKMSGLAMLPVFLLPTGCKMMGDPLEKESNPQASVTVMHRPSVDDVNTRPRFTPRRPAPVISPLPSEHSKTVKVPVKKVEAPVNNERYKVQLGDTLSDIALRFRVSVAAIRDANNLSGDRIYENQLLLIPGSSTRISTSVVEKEGPPTMTAEGEYVVRRGDVLAKIAKQTGVSVDRLVELNDIEDPCLLQVGQKLRLSERHASPPKAIVDTSVSLPIPESRTIAERMATVEEMPAYDIENLFNNTDAIPVITVEED
jgi:LysM repeat protein